MKWVAGFRFPERHFFVEILFLERILIDNLLVRIHFIIAMIRWTGLAPRELKCPLPDSFKSTFLVCVPISHEQWSDLKHGAMKCTAQKDLTSNIEAFVW